MACLLPAPLLWMLLAYTIMYGKETLFNAYPEVAREAKMSPPREIRRDYEKRNRRIKKKYFKAYKSRSNQQTVQQNNLSNDRIATLGSQVWQSRRNKVRDIFEQNGNQFGNHMHRNHRASSELRFRTQRNTRFNRTKRDNLHTRPVDNSHASVNPSNYEVYRNNNAYLHNCGSSRCAQFH